MPVIHPDAPLPTPTKCPRSGQGFADGPRVRISAPVPVIPQWTAEQTQRWQRLQEYASRAGGERKEEFLGRVAVALRCDLEFAAKAIEEYRRYCLLAADSVGDTRPSPLIDEVWCTHIVDTNDYLAYCTEVLRYELHRSRTARTNDEIHQQRLRYADLLSRYRCCFGAPPARFWPAPESQEDGRIVAPDSP